MTVILYIYMYSVNKKRDWRSRGGRVVGEKRRRRLSWDADVTKIDNKGFNIFSRWVKK